MATKTNAASAAKSGTEKLVLKPLVDNSKIGTYHVQVGAEA